MSSAAFPDWLEQSLGLAHPSWHPYLRAGLVAMDVAQPDYFSTLTATTFLPTDHRLFAAFAMPLDSVRYVLLGEGPYPRAESATGVCFMDGAVRSLWLEGAGLSKTVNRATSLRNFIKMLLVADGVLGKDHTGAQAMKPVAAMALTPDSDWIQTGTELQSNLIGNGFLLLNASLVFRPEVAPTLDAAAWLPFLRLVLQALQFQRRTHGDAIQLILWGRIAEKITQLPEAAHFSSVLSEHPYNLSFIHNGQMQKLFHPLHLLKKNSLNKSKKQFLSLKR